MERARHFYGVVLGLPEVARPPFDFGGAWYEFAEGRQLHLIVHPPTLTMRRSDIDDRDGHLALRVRSYRQTLDHSARAWRRRAREAEEPDAVGAALRDRPGRQRHRAQRNHSRLAVDRPVRRRGGRRSPVYGPRLRREGCGARLPGTGARMRTGPSHCRHSRFVAPTCVSHRVPSPVAICRIISTRGDLICDTPSFRRQIRGPGRAARRHARLADCGGHADGAARRGRLRRRIVSIGSTS